MNRDLTHGLDEAETDRLAARLDAYTGALSLEAVDGLFCALIAAPTLLMPSAYMPVILGDAPDGAFADQSDAQDTMTLLMRYWNAIAHDFEHDFAHVGYIEEPGCDGIPGRTWARGYMRGTRLSPYGWDLIFSDEREGLTVLIAIVAGEVDPAWPKEPLTAENCEELLGSIFAGAGRAYRYFRQDRLEQAQATSAAHAPVRRSHERTQPKIGRNDPCPCGSGKKYKRCCGGVDPHDPLAH